MALAVLLLLISPLWAARQGAELPTSGSGVGVVLSGGGAKGLYHIGVLKALEQEGVPIDYISGTSMGAIVGSLYAAGYSPDEIEQLALSGNVQRWVSGRIDPKHKYYYREIGNVPPAISVHIGFKNKDGRRILQVPVGLISSTQIDMALTELLTPATTGCGGDFDQLFVPFRCVATDMKARREVVFSSGNLPLAVRSSMSIPLAFPPIKKDSMLLYDGGVFNNYPWQCLDEEFNPQLLIGAICTEGNKMLDEKSGLIEQGMSFLMNKSEYDMPEGCSVTIRRAVPHSMFDFNKAREIIDMGYADAMAAMPQIRSHISTVVSPQSLAQRREEFRLSCPDIILDHYTFSGVNNAKKAYARDFLGVDEGFRSLRRGNELELTFGEFADNLYSIVGSGDFSTEFPEMTYNPTTDRYAISMGLNYKPSFKAQIGGNISSTPFNQAYIGLRYQLINRVAQTFFGDLYVGPVYSSGSLGGRTDLFWWVPLFIDASFNFSYKNLSHGTFGDLTEATNVESVRRNELFGSLSIGGPIKRRSLFSLKMNGGKITFRYQPDLPIVSQSVSDDLTRFSYVAGKAEIARNTLDKPLFPTRGMDLSVSAISVWGRDKYAPYYTSKFASNEVRKWVGARFKWNQYWSIAKWFTFGFNIDGVMTTQPDFSSVKATEMILPAYQPIPHSNMVYMPDFHAKRYVAGGIIPTFRFTDSFMLRAGFYTMYRDREMVNNSLHYISEASLIYHTTLGPVSLSLTKYELDSWDNMYLMFNFGYAIFAPRGTFY